MEQQAKDWYLKLTANELIEVMARNGIDPFENDGVSDEDIIRMYENK